MYKPNQYLGQYLCIEPPRSEPKWRADRSGIWAEARRLSQRLALHFTYTAVEKAAGWVYEMAVSA
jgi:hypothetical protein